MYIQSLYPPTFVTVDCAKDNGWRNFKSMEDVKDAFDFSKPYVLGSIFVYFHVTLN